MAMMLGTATLSTQVRDLLIFVAMFCELLHKTDRLTRVSKCHVCRPSTQLSTCKEALKAPHACMGVCLTAYSRIEF